jgi:Tfp pilus assembly protein PilO
VKGSDKAVVLGVVMAVVLVAFYMMALSPKRDKASQLGKDVTALKAQVSSQEQVAQFGEQARQEFPVFYGRLVVLGKAVPAEADTASLLVQLSSIARRTDVDFRGISLAAGGGSSGATASSASPAASTDTSTSGTTSTPAPSGSTGSSDAAPASGTTAPTTTAAPATEAGAANLPIGATVGPGDLGTMPYNLNFVGNYFQVADFLQGLDGLIHTRGNSQVAADGRLLTIDAFSLSDPQGTGPNPKLNVAISVTSYVTPASQGLTAGATPGGPAPSLTQPQTQPASAPVSP